MNEKEDIQYMTELPTQRFLYPYVLLTLHSLGGYATKREAVDALAQRFNLSEELLRQRTPEGNEPVFENNVAFSRSHLHIAGYIDKREYGIWHLSDKGKEMIPTLEGEDQSDLDKFSKKVRKLIQSPKGKEEKRAIKNMKNVQRMVEGVNVEEAERVEEGEEVSALDKMLREDLAQLREIEPHEVERICRLLMKELGYKFREQSKKTRDKGIDGEGFLVFGLVRFKVVFQVKRYGQDKSIQPNKIRELAGARERVNAEKAVFITTSDFTQPAKNEALDLGIELVDGNKLMKLLYENNIGYEKIFTAKGFKKEKKNTS